MISRDLVSDWIINLAGLYAVIVFLWHLLRNRSRSRLEGSLIFLFSILATLLTFRMYSWYHHQNSLLQSLVMIPAYLLPLACLLIAESLMRRHSPFALKLLVTAGAVCFLCLDAMFGLNLQSGVYFALFLSGSLLVIGVFVILRDRDELSPSENQIIDAFSVISFLSTPLVLTDFREEFDFPVRAGSIAVLMAVYIFLRASKKEPTRKIIFLELSRQLLRGCIIGAGFWALFFHDLPINEIDYLVCCLISYSLLLLFTILDHVSARNHESAASSVTSWIAGGKFDSRFDFKLALAEIGSLSDSISISQNDLEKYNIPELKSFFHANKVTSLSKLRRNASVSEGIESQIFDILTSNGATHLLVLSEDPLEILLCRLPELEIGAIGINELGAIQKVGELTYRSKPNEG